MPVDRETIVTDGGGDGTGAGMMVGIAVVILLLVVGGITVFHNGFSVGGNSVVIDVPKVTVTK